MPREGRGSCSLHWCLSRWGEDPEDHPHPFSRHVTGLLPPQLQGKVLVVESRLGRRGEDPEDHPHLSFRHVTGPLPPQLQGNRLGGNSRVRGLLQQAQTLLLRQLRG